MTRRTTPPADGSAALPWQPRPGGLRLAVRLTPRSARPGLDGIVADADGRPSLHLKVASPPVEGAANTALIALLADALGLRKADVRIVAGDGARQKRLDLDGDPATLAAALAAWLAAPPGR